MCQAGCAYDTPVRDRLSDWPGLEYTFMGEGAHSAIYTFWQALRITISLTLNS